MILMSLAVDGCEAQDNQPTNSGTTLPLQNSVREKNEKIFWHHEICVNNHLMIQPDTF